MALSPWHLSESLEIYDVALMLSTNLDIFDLRGNDVAMTDGEVLRARAYDAELFRAIQTGELKYFRLVPREDTRELVEEAERVPELLLVVERKDLYKIEVTRQEVYRWLKALGIENEDIPETLRVTPTKCEPVAKSTPSQATEGDELRILEALGLLIETMAKQSHKYRIGDNGRPNCAQIAEAMSQQAGDVYGMKPRTLQERLSKALAAWQQKCK
ncbi:hypothetical protein HHSLTHF2_19210 [Vreelandella venusta]|jgi:hypothetical protein|uniref:Uncharacterized protein n=1 Tax=Halomonas hydrothermalis TaxID=115561 RepID=A0A6F8U4G1_9GAMM|nr:hypothetical protein [Halomonas hydrothermalis]BCB08031.1 hypothetical protein HHSLTHF2_19210 [Halomonas hydrothermalis]